MPDFSDKILKNYFRVVPQPPSKKEGVKFFHPLSAAGEERVDKC
jgi:hypothetical protein